MDRTRTYKFPQRMLNMTLAEFVESANKLKGCRHDKEVIIHQFKLEAARRHEERKELEG